MIGIFLASRSTSFAPDGSSRLITAVGFVVEVQPSRRLSTKCRSQIGNLGTTILAPHTGSPRGLDLSLRHDDRGPFFGGMIDESVAITFFAPQCDEKTVPLHTARVIRDA